jgi:hypothetical protein
MSKQERKDPIAGLRAMQNNDERLGYLVTCVKKMRDCQNKINKLSQKSPKFQYWVNATLAWQEIVDRAVEYIEALGTIPEIAQETESTLKNIQAQADAIQDKEHEPALIHGVRSGKSIMSALKSADAKQRAEKKAALGKGLGEIIQEQQGGNAFLESLPGGEPRTLTEEEQLRKATDRGEHTPEELSSLRKISDKLDQEDGVELICEICERSLDSAGLCVNLSCSKYAYH